MAFRSMEPRAREAAPGAPRPTALTALLTAPSASPPGLLLLLGEGPPPREWPAERLVREPGGGSAAREVTAVLGYAPAGGEDAWLDSVARRLPEGGRLVVVLPEDARSGEAQGRAWVRRLSEAGFVVLRELAPGELAESGRGALAARRDSFVVRSFQPADEGEVRRLFAESFPAARSREHWRWKYDENPWGERAASVAQASAGEVVVYYAGYPVPFWLDGSPHLALQMGDTMTDARVRRVGRGTSSLLARTVRHFFACHRRGRFAFYYGFNTGGIQRFCGWFIGGSRAEPVAYRSRPSGSPMASKRRAYRVERVSKVDPAWDRLFHRAAPAYGFLVRRDAEYVDWRYLRCPDERPYVVLAAYRFGRLVGWSAFRREGERVRWGDALFEPRHAGAAASVLAQAQCEPELTGAAAVEAWFPERPAWWHEELERLGFVRAPEPADLALMYLPDREERLPLERLYYTMGDGDLF